MKPKSDRKNRMDFDHVTKDQNQAVAAIEKKTKKPKATSKAKSSEAAKPDLNFQTYIQLLEKKAYELYEKRGAQDGSDQDDWYEAEKLIREEMLKGG